MKRTRTLLTTSAALLLLALLTHRPSGQAQESKPDDPYKKGQPARDALVDVRDENVPAVVSFHFEIFSLALTEAGPLLREPLSDEERLQRVLKLVGDGKARQERLIIARTKSGQRMVVESIDEFRYGTDWGLADFGTLNARKMKAPKDSGPVELKPGDPEVVFKDQVSGIGVITTACETRNTGDTIEIEPVIGPDGKTIDLNLVPQTVHYVGDRMIPGPNPIGQPLFETQKVTTAITVEDGKPYLLGTQNPPFGTGLSKDDVAHQIWLEFITPHLVTPQGKPYSKDAASNPRSSEPYLVTPQGKTLKYVTPQLDAPATKTRQ